MFVFNGLLQTRTPLSQQPSASELEEKYKRVMMTNAQLDNEKQMLRYEVELLKERLDDGEEQHIELERQFANVRRVSTVILNL
jgi:predicted nuclease with TOPRIM domain